MFLLPTKDFLDVVESILLAAGKPIEIGDLVKVLVSLEAIDPDADFKKQKHDVYSKVWMEPKKHGDASRWQRVGKGMWCHVTFLTAEMLASEAGTIRTLDEKRTRAKMEGRTPRPTREERHVDEGDKKCGNCSHLRFFGAHFLQLRSGSCEKWPESNVNGAYVLTVMQACPHWKRRTEAQHEADRYQHGLDQIAVAKANAGTHVRRRGDNKRPAPTGATVHTSQSVAEDTDEEE